MIRPEAFGAVGDGRADDTHALQAALDRAGDAPVVLSGQGYATSATLLVPSGVRLEGSATLIRALGDDRPVLASKAWAEPGTPLRGRTRIAGLRIEASGRGSRQDGIVLHDFWSEIADCEVVSPGGRGIVLTATDRAGTPAGSTLVENRIRRCTVRDSVGTAFFLGEPANGKLTDGELTDALASLRPATTAPAVTIGHAAGWTVRGLHTYGGRPAVAVEVRQGYFTRLADLYIEGVAGIGLALPAVQTTVAVSNLQIAAERLEGGQAFVAVSGHRDFVDPVVQFANAALTVARPGGGGEALRNEDGRVRITGMPVLVAGPGRGEVRGAAPPAGVGPASGASGRRVETWTGRDPRQVRLASAPREQSFAQAILVTIAGRSGDGSIATAFAGMVTWVRAEAAGQAILVDVVPFGTPYGFAVLPEAHFTFREGGAVLDLAFTPLASGAGEIAIL